MAHKSKFKFKALPISKQNDLISICVSNGYSSTSASIELFCTQNKLDSNHVKSWVARNKPAQLGSTTPASSLIQSTLIRHVAGTYGLPTPCFPPNQRAAHLLPHYLSTYLPHIPSTPPAPPI